MPTPYNAVAPFVNPSPTSGTYAVNIYTGYADFRPPPPLAFKKPARKPAKQLSENLAALIPRGNRKAISEFSKPSKRNFLKKIFSLSVLPDLFITLTYPGSYTYDRKDSKAWKRNLDNFVHAFRRQFPDSWFFWKLEPQRRGAPHFHLVGSLGVRVNIVLLRKFIAETWFRVVGSGDVKHLQAGIQADFVNDSFGKVKRYVCKYVSKISATDPAWAAPGRWWGIVGRDKLPSSPCCHVLLTEDTFFKLRRLVRKWMAHLRTSAGYSKRLRKLASFFVLADHRHILAQLEFTIGFSLEPLAK